LSPVQEACRDPCGRSLVASIGGVTLVESERAGLADTLASVGPDAPTLCAGWTTTDLALHVVLRERLDPANPGGTLPGSDSPRRERRRRRFLARHGYLGLVEMIRTGPPRWSPFGMPGAERWLNTVELFVHHEDVLRARPDSTRRVLPAETQDELRKHLKRLAPLMLRRCPTGVDALLPDGTSMQLHKGAEAAILSGEPSEIILYLEGRRSEADITILGAAGGREALAHLRLGV
jgi:uncharacterized protein (TIGR03085 family)